MHVHRQVDVQTPKYLKFPYRLRRITIGCRRCELKRLEYELMVEDFLFWENWLEISDKKRDMLYKFLMSREIPKCDQHGEQDESYKRLYAICAPYLDDDNTREPNRLEIV